MAEVTLSIITINLNNLSGLQQTVQSVRDQSVAPHQHIIIDGNSTDGSLPYLKTLNYPFLSWISEPDTGVYHAMNKGIQKGTGEFLLFLNSGDVLANPNVVADIQDYFRNTPTNRKAIHYGFMRRGTPEKYSLVNVPSPLPIAYLMENSLPHPATLIPRSLFDTFGLYDEAYKIVSDWKFLINCYFGSVSFCKLPLVISYFDTSGLSSNHTQLFEERERVFSQIWKLRFWRSLINTYRFIKYTVLRSSPKSLN